MKGHRTGCDELNDDCLYMLWVMNQENCIDKNRHFCSACPQRIFCEEKE